MEVIGLSGRLGTGKNYIAEKCLLPRLQQRNPLPTMVVAFADFLKIETALEQNLSYLEAFGPKTSATRRLFQNEGKRKRNLLGDDYYIRALHMFINLHYDRGIRRFLITDVRFLSELIFIQEKLNGKVIRLLAPNRHIDRVKLEVANQGDLPFFQRLFGYVFGTVSFEDRVKEMMMHPSETALDIPCRPFDFLLNNDYLDESALDENIDNILNTLNRVENRL